MKTFRQGTDFRFAHERTDEIYGSLGREFSQGREIVFEMKVGALYCVEVFEDLLSAGVLLCLDLVGDGLDESPECFLLGCASTILC